MARLKPLNITVKTGVTGFIILLTALISFVIKWETFYDFFIPDGNPLNWRFVIFLASTTGLVVWFVMHEFWRREYAAHEETKKARENVEHLLSEAEKARRADVITGVPNWVQFTEDIDRFFTEKEDRKEGQVVLIDIKNFRQVNKQFGFLKGDQLIRAVAQEIYSAMRRNENMYKRKTLERDEKALLKQFYRHYPGGDEFVFLMEGDQSDAVGFVVFRLYDIFKSLTGKTPAILGVQFPLSFHCAIAPITKRDTATDVFARIEDCYMRAAEGTEPFTMCWHPADFEHTIKDPRKKTPYVKARERFQIMNVGEPLGKSAFDSPLPPRHERPQ